MKTADISYGFVVFLCINILFLFSETPMVGAQPAQSGGGSNNNNNYPYARFSPSMAIIIVVLIAALFFMGFFSIYIRHCSENSSGGVRRALSLRSRRTPAARGLEASVLETFPTFSYSEVKDHKIGKGTLECAVCLNEFQEDETIRLIPKCDHVFHPECIDAWLESHVTCPVCRANLAQTEPASTNPVGESEANQMNETVERSNSTGTGGEVVIQVENEIAPPPPPRSWSVARRPRMFKFRSHSTGHDSLVLPGENLDRFTLKLPEQVRKEVVDRAMLNRAKSYAAGGSWGRGARSYRRIERPELELKSERWNFSFFSRALSMRSPRVGSENAQGSRSGGTPVKMPSFKCLEPKAVDEAHLVSARSPV